MIYGLARKNPAKYLHLCINGIVKEKMSGSWQAPVRVITGVHQLIESRAETRTSCTYFRQGSERSFDTFIASEGAL